MPTKYQRKGGISRGVWTEEQLRNAAAAIEAKTMGVNEAAKTFNVPKATLIRRIATGNLIKTSSLGPASAIGHENERKLVSHIKKLQKYGFAPTREDVRRMAFELAEQLKVKHRFNLDTKMAGYDWLQLFLRRHPDLSVRTAEGVSIARSTALNRDVVNNYFNLLEEILTTNDLFDKPGNIFNVDETGLQLNNKPGQVIAAKGSKNVVSITSGEKGKTISVVACCNGEGTFLPPYCIFKGKNLKDDYLNGMPPGSVVKMSEKSAYVNKDIFFDWLKNHFFPRKPSGKVVLILDGHTSHCNLCEMLQFAEENDIIMICLPSHTTHYLQPLDRSVFKSLKGHYYTACNNFIKKNPNKKLSRTNFGHLLAEAWTKSATQSNAVAGFRATGIIPFSPDAIPDHAFLSNDTPVSVPTVNNNIVEEQDTEETFTTSEDVAIPGSSRQEETFQNNNSELTPGKRLDVIHPVPVIASQVKTTRKRGRALAEVLTSPEHIEKRKATSDKKNKEKRKRLVKRAGAKTIRKKRVIEQESSSSESEEARIELDDSDSSETWSENDCAGCGENYSVTKKPDDWLQCANCSRWLHESCMKYEGMCERCGKKTNPRVIS